MYIPAAFKEDRIDLMHELMRAHPLGLLISHGPGGLLATPVPFVSYAEAGGQGTLRAHLARANPHWQELATVSECMVVFQGEHGYVSPSWYPSKQTHHRVVPTWNYATVHIWGKPLIIDDVGWLARQLNDLTNAQEGRRAQPWAMGDAPSDYLATQMRALVGIEIAIARSEGKWKLSQNKDHGDRLGVIAGMRTTQDPHQHLPLADLLEQRLKDRFPQSGTV